MVNEEGASELVERSKTLIFFVAPYCIAIGLLYLWGYWSTFDVNILQFAGLTDVVASALFPIAIGSVSLAVGMILGEIHSRKFGPSIARSLPPPETTAAYFSKNGESLFGIYIMLFFVFMLSDISWKWGPFPILLTFPIMILIIKNKSPILGYFPARHQALVLFIVIWMLPWSYTRGLSDAVFIRSGVSFLYVEAGTVVKPQLEDGAADTRLRYVGHVGDFDFFFDPVADSVSIAKVQDENSLTLHKYKRKQTGESLSKVIDRWWKSIRNLFQPEVLAPNANSSK